MGYFLYKGLKKPLVFFGLKDKYIYYAMGAALSGIVLIAILSSLFGIFGLVIGAATGTMGVLMCYKTQDKKGLYNKRENNMEIHIIGSKLKNLKFYKKRANHEIQEESI